MPDSTDSILTRLPRHLVWVCAGCDDCAPPDGLPRSPTPCDGPSQNGAWVVTVAAAESAVREARDATVQEIVDWLRDPDTVATTFGSTRDVAWSVARRFPNGGTHK